MSTPRKPRSRKPKPVLPETAMPEPAAEPQAATPPSPATAPGLHSGAVSPEAFWKAAARFQRLR